MECNPNWYEVLCQDLDRARSLTAMILYRHGEWDQLSSLKVSPSEYCTSPFPGINFQSINDFKKDVNITEILRKQEDLPTTFDRDQVAIDNFFSSEEGCRMTNLKLQNLSYYLRSNSFLDHGQRPRKEILEFVRVWRRITKESLKGIPLDLHPKFSSGSTYDDRFFILPQDKLQSQPTVTADAYTVLQPIWSKTMWSENLCKHLPYRSSPKFVLGNRFTTVPKDCQKSRGICVEPSLNVTHQLSVGACIRRRLRDLGIDLLYGQSFHRKTVKSASLRCDTGSIDLSSASDTISYELVKLVLPPSWFDLLDSLRSPYTYIKGRDGKKYWHKNQKFSSMGNGYTFELESLLFYTLCLTVCELKCHFPRVCSVYGDDILIDTEMCNDVVRALSYFGFTTNKRKTFIDGTPFRESCGADFYMGVPVRGHYVLSEPKEPTDYVKLLNGIRRMASFDDPWICRDFDRYDHPSCTIFDYLGPYQGTWDTVYRLLPNKVRRIFGPTCFGDTVIHSVCWRNRITGGSSMRVISPTFSDNTTPYDKKVWHPGTVLTAIVHGSLAGRGDTHYLDPATNQWSVRKGYQLRPRVEPDGYCIKRVQLPTFMRDPHNRTLSHQIDEAFGID